ncbi:MAG TPA: hypothetical protein VIM57_07950 [Luteolibacter sp.]
MPRDNRLLIRSVGLLGLMTLAWLGNRAGHSMARAGWFQSPTVSANVARNESPSSSSATRSAPASADQAASALKRLRAIAAASPSLVDDWEAQAQIDGILAHLSADELAAIFAELGNDMDPGLLVLVQKVGVAWAAKDPSAALSAALAKFAPRGAFYASTIFAKWAANDPAAALAWANSADLPTELAEIRSRGRGEAISQLLERDFDLATSELLKLGENKEGWSESGVVLSLWANAYVNDPAMRERLIEFAKSTGRPDDYAQLNSALLRAWPQDDADAMRVYLEGLRDYLNSGAVPVEARPNVDATAVGAAIYREYTGPALEWWMGRYSQSFETPLPLRQSIVSWVQKYPDQVRRWFEEQPASPQRDSLSTTVVTTLAARGKFQEAAGMLQGINDPKLRQSATERLDFAWSQKAPQAAAAWRASHSEPAASVPQNE